MRKLLFLFLITIAGGLYAQNNWVRMADFGGGNRDDASGFAIGNTCYILSGTDTGAFYTDMWAWNATTNVWTAVTPYPGGQRIGLRSVSLDGYGYVIGGGKPSDCFLKYGGGVCGLGFFKDIWRYDPDSDNWTSVDTSFPGLARNMAVMVADPSNSTFYYGTGNNNGTTYLSDWWMYKPSTNQWKQRASFPGGQRNNAVGFYLNGMIYVGSGNNNDSIHNASNEFYEYTPGTNRWKRIADIPGMPIRCASAFAIGNYGYVCLGISDTSYTTCGWRYDPSTNTWLSIASYAGGPIADAVAFTIGANAYVGTGSHYSNEYAGFWKYVSDSTLGMTLPANVNVYPNPAKTTTTLKFSGIQALPAQLIIIDLLGNVVTSTTVNTNAGQVNLDVSTLNSGIYFYEVSGSGKNLTSGKFIISK